MRYVNRVLQEGEAIRYDREKANVPMYVLGVLMLAISFFMFLKVKHLSSYEIRTLIEQLDPDAQLFTFNDAMTFKNVLHIVNWLILLLALWFFARAGSTEITVTNQRVIYKRGLIARSVREMPISHIDVIDVRQSVLGRIFGFGSVILRSAGGTSLPIRKISRPIILRQHISTVRVDS